MYKPFIRLILSVLLPFSFVACDPITGEVIDGVPDPFAITSASLKNAQVQACAQGLGTSANSVAETGMAVGEHYVIWVIDSSGQRNLFDATASSENPKV